MKCECDVVCADYDYSQTPPTLPSREGDACITINFGSVVYGSSLRKIHQIKNDTDNDLEFVVQRDPKSNPMYYAFDFHYTEMVPKNGIFKLSIIYKPLYSEVVNVDTLVIFDKLGRTYRLILRGESIGSHIQTSTSELRCFANAQKPICQKIIEFINVSDVDAIFNFDVKDKTIGCFKIDTCSGILKAGKHMFIQITFAPQEEGIYMENVYFLELSEKPKRIQLIGYYSQEEVVSENIRLKFYSTPQIYKSGYSGYLYDSMSYCETPPPFSLTKNSLDFGSIDSIASEDNSKTVVTSLTNHLTDNVTVVWLDDPVGVFKITPKNAIVPPGESVLLECIFTPNIADRFYDRIMYGRVFWTGTRDGDDEDEYQNVPLPVQIRFLGSTFPPNKVWLPQIKFPQRIAVRPCLPSNSSYTSFMMSISGCLPVSYRFVAPKNAKFTVKPSQGIIPDYAILAVGFVAENVEEKAFVERWSVILNGRETDCHYIFLSCFCEKPKLQIDEDNKIIFDPVMPDCQDIKTVLIKNVSTHYLCYKIFESDEVFIRFNHVEGELAANEETSLECVATGNEHGPCDGSFFIEQRFCESKNVYGRPFNVHIETKLKCVYSELCSLPDEFDFGDLRVGKKHTAEFELFNFGQSTIHYKLHVKAETLEEEIHLNKCVHFTPALHCVKPGCKTKIMVTVECDERGTYEFPVIYHIRLNENSQQIVSEHSKPILIVRSKCDYPTLKIETIVDYTNGNLFSKAVLWKSFGVEKINQHLKAIKHNETRSVDLYLPDNEVTDDDFRVTMTVKNESVFDTSVELKRRKMCTCPLVIEDKSLTFRQVKYKCIHREMFKATLSNTDFPGGHLEQLEFRISYLQSEEMNMCYHLNMSDKRTLIFYFHFNVLAHDVDAPSRYHSSVYLAMPTVALCEKFPAFHPLWFYNNSSNVVSIGVDYETHEPSTMERQYKVMKCINRQTRTMQPSSVFAFYFMCDPLEYKKYTCTFNLRLGSQDTKMICSCTAVPQVSSKISSSYNIVATKSIQLEPDVSYASDYIVVPRLVSWSIIETLIFIRNFSKDVMGYSIQSNSLEGVMSIESLHGRGILKPKEIHPVVLRIETFDYPMKVKLHVTVKFFNHTKYFKYKSSLNRYNLRQEQIKHEFTITEKGTEYPKNDVVVEPSPNPFFRSFMMEFNTINIFDVDLHMDAEEQLRLSSQFTLKLDEERILRGLLPKKQAVEKPINVVEGKSSDKRVVRGVDGSGDKQIPEKGENFSHVKNIALMKGAVESLLLTALESKVFKKALELKQTADPPYYVQFDVAENVHYTDAAKAKKQAAEEQLSMPQAPHLAEVFRELILDALHEVMHLGPPVGKKIDRKYIYDSKFKSQYNAKKK